MAECRAFFAGIPVAPKRSAESEIMQMKKMREKQKPTDGKPAANCAAVLAILAEMARQVNLHISKIDLAPIDGAWLARDEDAQD